jgi:protein involved in polysaccharide export with SLBB domain
MTDTFKKIEITTERHTVTIDDQNSHVTVDSQGDITIRALGKISIQGLAGVDIQGAMVKIN